MAVQERHGRHFFQKKWLFHRKRSRFDDYSQMSQSSNVPVHFKRLLHMLYEGPIESNGTLKIEQLFLIYVFIDLFTTATLWQNTGEKTVL